MHIGDLRRIRPMLEGVVLPLGMLGMHPPPEALFADLVEQH